MIRAEIEALFVRGSWTRVSLSYPDLESAKSARARLYRWRRLALNNPEQSILTALCAPLVGFSFEKHRDFTVSLIVHPRDNLQMKLQEVLKL